ncbi:MAG: methyltransferase domain-containing protein, partial [Gammaproteobacteria bacterium]
SYAKAFSINPNFAPAALGLGQVCYDLGRSEEALRYLEQSLQADPANADALCCCGQALSDLGHLELALQFMRRAIETAPSERRYTLAAIDVLHAIEFKAENAWYEQFLIECLDAPHLPHDALTNVATSMLWVKPAVREALEATQLDPSHLEALAREPLLVRLLSRAIGRNWAFEQFVVKLRAALARLRSDEHLALMAAVAEQAFNAGYVQYQSVAEVELERELLQKKVTSLTPVELVTIAFYRPLVDVPGASELTDRPDSPEALDRVVERTLREPMREREIEPGIPALTRIQTDVSRRVQAQYEEHPYPRWIATQSVEGSPRPLVQDIAQNALNFENPAWPERPKVLVPGCGTGYHPLLLARKHPETDVLAVDLSRTSLAYAIRKQEELEVENVRFCQADVLALGELNDRFDYIDCSGVLHHLASPLEGWRVLTDLLEPGGVMRIGLYSELARKTIVAARDRVEALGIESTPSAIRDFRRRIMTDLALSELRSLAETTADFFSMGGIRDLIFHVQERRFDLPTIKQNLAELELRFGGFLLHDRDVVRQFHAIHPTSSEWLDLDCWSEFERQHPNTFYRMYQFYCLKPVQAVDAPTDPRA